jgi:DNA polymerase III sliding clamp (beta) subunit (PCNA family)
MKFKTLKSIRTILWSRNHTLPILDCFYIDKEFLVFTDLETTIKIRHHFPVQEESKPFCVDSNWFLKRLESVKSPFILSYDDVKEKVIFQMPESSSALPALKAEDFPAEVTGEIKSLFTLTTFDISKMQIASGFLADDELRPVMSTVCYSGDLICGSDAHMLYYGKIKGVYKSDVMFTKKVIRLMKLFPELDYQVYDLGSKFLKLESPDITIVFRKVDGNYPNFRSVITEHPKKVVIPVKETIDALNSIAFAANEVSHQVRLKMKGSKLTMHTKDLDFSLEASETVNILNPDNHELEFGFKIDFLIRILKVLLNAGYYQADMHFEDPTKNFTFGSQLLLMPMMINE